MKNVIYQLMASGFLVLALMVHGADALTQNLQRGLYEEEANHNLDAAIKAYQSVLTQAEEQRKVVATALFRLGECYRKLGKTNDANAQYERILRDFSEQEQLVKLSREQLGRRGSGPGGKEQVAQKSVEDQEAEEVARIKALVKESPDFVNSRTVPGVSLSQGDTLLHYAAGRGYSTLAEFLLANGADINGSASDRMTPLHRAVQYGRKGMVELLLARGADPNRTSATGGVAPLYLPGAGGVAPLHLAVANGYKSIAELLLANKADVNAFSPASGEQPLHIAAGKGFVAICELLLDHGAAVSELSKKDGKTPLHIATANGQREVVELLLKRKADVNARGAGGSTPLHVAVADKRMDVLRILLAAGADPNQQNSDGESPLFRTSDTQIMKLLLDHKADPNLKNRIGATPLAYLMGDQPPPAEAIDLLLESGADSNIALPGSRTPVLFSPVANRNLRVLESLLAHGANPNVIVDGETPLSRVQSNLRESSRDTRYEWQQIEKLLVEHGANKNLHLLSSISYERPGWAAPAKFFTRGEPDFNRYTLLEFFGTLWEEPSYGRGLSGLPVPFPDLAHVTIARIDPGTSKMKELEVNLEEIVGSGECSKDPWLEWGDRISVPEQDHVLNETWAGLEPQVREFLEKCLTRHVNIVVKQVTNTVKLVPNLIRLQRGGVPSIPRGGFVVEADQAKPKGERRVFGFRLKQVVYGAQVLRASSDITRVHVKRNDPQTNRQLEWTIDLSNQLPGAVHPLTLPATPSPAVPGVPPPGPGQRPIRQAPPAPALAQAPFVQGPIAPEQDLWLRDGDIIEIPEKP